VEVTDVVVVRECLGTRVAHAVMNAGKHAGLTGQHQGKVEPKAVGLAVLRERSDVSKLHSRTVYEQLRGT